MLAVLEVPFFVLGRFSTQFARDAEAQVAASLQREKGERGAGHAAPFASSGGQTTVNRSRMVSIRSCISNPSRAA